MAKLEDDILNEIDAFIEEEKKPKRKGRPKKEVEEKIVEEKPKKRGRKKKEVIIEEPVIEETIEDIVEEEMNNVSIVTEDTTEVPEVEEEEELTAEVPVISEKVIEEEEEEDEDIFITQSFQPIKKKKRLKRSVIKFFKILIILTILGVVGFFIFNKVLSIYNSTRPVNIYKAFVNGIVEESTRVLGNIDIDEYKLDIDVDTNMKSYDYLNDVNFGYGFNVIENKYHAKEVKYQDYIYYVENAEEVGVYTLIDDETVYKKYTTALAYDSYTIIAYLDENRTVDASKPNHVVNKEKTAKKLSGVLDMTEEKILSLLNKENMYQVYLKKGISATEKEEIESLELPGIEFEGITKGTPMGNKDDVYKSKYEESSIRDLIKFVSLNYDNLDDIIEGNGKIINDILKVEYIKELEDEIEINGENIEVKCLSIEITDEIIREYINELKRDNDLVIKMAKLLNKDEDVLIRYIEDKLNEMDGNEFNLYVTKDYKLVGFDYEIDGFRDVYVYNYNDSYDVSIKYDKYVKYLLNSLGINVGSINNLNLKINNDNKVNVATDNKDKFNLTVKEFDKSIISFEYKNNSSTKVMEVVIKKDSIVIEYKNDDGKYFDIDITLSKNEYTDMDLDDVVISSKKVNAAADEFYSEMNRDQKDTYNLINDIIYGELS